MHAVICLHSYSTTAHAAMGTATAEPSIRLSNGHEQRLISERTCAAAWLHITGLGLEKTPLAFNRRCCFLSKPSQNLSLTEKLGRIYPLCCSTCCRFPPSQCHQSNPSHNYRLEFSLWKQTHSGKVAYFRSHSLKEDIFP